MCHDDEGHQAAGVAFDEGHGCGDEGGEGPQRSQDEADSVLGRSTDSAGEDGFPRAGQPEEPEFAHNSGEEDAHRCGSGAVGVGQPEVPRHHGRFDQECGGEKGQCHRQQAVSGPTGKSPSHLGQVEGAGAGVEQHHPGEHQEAANGVGDGKVDGALDGAFPFRVVAGQDEPGDGDQLERNEHIEQVAGPGEIDAGGDEDQYQGRVPSARGAEEPAGIDQGGDREDPGEDGQAPAASVDHVIDADDRAVNWVPPPNQ